MVSENSVDVEDVRDEMRTDLIMLNRALKQLNKDWDYSEVLNSPSLTDQRPLRLHKFQD